MVNNRTASMDTLIYENFSIEWTVLSFGAAEVSPTADAPTEEETSKAADGDAEAAETAENSPAAPADTTDTADTAGGASTAQPMNNNTDNGINLTVNGEQVRLTGKDNYIFIDIFNVIDFDIHAGGGKAVYTMVNNEICGYTKQLKDGDVITIGWKEQ
jgi:hypothetical protein